MLGFALTKWDYITFAVLMLIGMGILAAIVLLLGLPGRIAVSRKHPDAEAVTLLGWFGGFAVLPWMQALIWAFKPTDIVDIRKMPAATSQAPVHATEDDKARGDHDRTAA